MLKICLVCVLTLLVTPVWARGGGHGGGRVHYGGGKHTTSHGGSYVGGSGGSSHKGGSYRNFSTGHQYGTHK